MVNKHWSWISLVNIVVIAFGFWLGAGQFAQTDEEKIQAQLMRYEHVPGEAVVKVKQTTGFSSLALWQTLGSKIEILSIKPFETNKQFYKVKIADEANLAKFIEEANKHAQVVYAEPNYIYHAYVNNQADSPAEVIPNDVDFSKLWGLKNTGQQDAGGQAGVAGADIGATKAWAITKGSKNMVVAVIDTGVDYTHTELADNIYVNKGESGDGKENNGIDDDGNGFVDDVHGWNFAGVSTNNPMDDNSHGTHVSGTIGAKGGNGIGVAGVNWDVSILPVKFLSGDGSGTLEDAVKAIQYATKMGAKIMSNSWGGGPFTQAMFDAIKEARDKGALFVAAAGNDSTNSDSDPHYPAGYQLENVIAVAATTNQDALASFSTYGPKSVHIAAPGNKVYSTIPGNKYDTYSGTSMATPHVSGAAALLWSAHPELTYAEVKDRLLKSADPISMLARKVSSGGRLNIYNALVGYYPPSNKPSDSDWVDQQLQAPIASEHPYKDGATQEWNIAGPANAKFIRIHFSKYDLEEGYDFVRLYDDKGTVQDEITGTADSGGFSWYVPGNKVRIVLSSDTSVSKWGFEVDKYQAVFEK